MELLRALRELGGFKKHRLHAIAHSVAHAKTDLRRDAAYLIRPYTYIACTARRDAEQHSMLT